MPGSGGVGEILAAARRPADAADLDEHVVAMDRDHFALVARLGLRARRRLPRVADGDDLVERLRRRAPPGIPLPGRARAGRECSAADTCASLLRRCTRGAAILSPVVACGRLLRTPSARELPRAAQLPGEAARRRVSEVPRRPARASAVVRAATSRRRQGRGLGQQFGGGDGNTGCAHGRRRLHAVALRADANRRACAALLVAGTLDGLLG